MFEGHIKVLGRGQDIAQACLKRSNKSNKFYKVKKIKLVLELQRVTFI